MSLREARRALLRAVTGHKPHEKIEVEVRDIRMVLSGLSDREEQFSRALAVAARASTVVRASRSLYGNLIDEHGDAAEYDRAREELGEALELLDKEAW